MEGQWWWQLNPSSGADGRDEWRAVLTLLGIPYCVHFCEFMRHCVLPGKSHLWACWSEELLKLALAGYRATGLAGCTPAFTSDVHHSFASLPCAIQKYFVTLLVGSFLKCYFKPPKKGTMEVQAVHPLASRCAIQLWDTIHYCSDRSLLLKIDGGLHAKLQMKGKCTGDECQLLFLSKALLKDQYYFLFHWLNLKTTVKGLPDLTVSTILSLYSA